MAQITEEKLIEYRERCSSDEKLNFFIENNFTNLIDIVIDSEDREMALSEAIQSLMDHQMNKKPQQMNEREREVWFASTTSRLIKVNQMIGFIISEIEKMKKL